jgi:hypothetical protein
MAVSSRLMNATDHRMRCARISSGGEGWSSLK